MGISLKKRSKDVQKINTRNYRMIGGMILGIRLLPTHAPPIWDGASSVTKIE